MTDEQLRRDVAELIDAIHQAVKTDPRMDGTHVFRSINSATWNAKVEPAISRVYAALVEAEKGKR